jgi:hypothetical protein
MVMSSHAEVMFDLLGLRASDARHSAFVAPLHAIRLPHHSATIEKSAALNCSGGWKPRLGRRLCDVCPTNNYLEIRAKCGIDIHATVAFHRAIRETAGSRHDRLVLTRCEGVPSLKPLRALF